VAPLLDLVGLGELVHDLVRDGVGVLDLEAALDDAHLLDVEGVLVDGDELLEAVPELAGLAPVAALTGAAGVQRAVGTVDDAVHADLEARGVAEDRTLELAVDLLEERALDAAVGDVAEEHLPRELAVLHEDRVARGV